MSNSPQQYLTLEQIPVAWIALMSALDYSIPEMAQEVGCLAQDVNYLLTTHPVKSKADEIRKKTFGADLEGKFDKAAPKALEYAQRLINGEIPGAKVSEMWSASQWILEKVTGKPMQKLDIDGGKTFRDVLEKMTQISEQIRSGEAGSLESTGLKDVTMKKAENPIDKWVRESIPVLGSEKS